MMKRSPYWRRCRSGRGAVPTAKREQDLREESQEPGDLERVQTPEPVVGCSLSELDIAEGENLTAGLARGDSLGPPPDGGVWR